MVSPYNEKTCYRSRFQAEKIKKDEIYLS